MGADFAPFAREDARRGAARAGDPHLRALLRAQLAAGARGTLSSREIEPVERRRERRGARRASPRRGRAALARTVVVKLNGGLGTTMGMRKAKSLLPVKDGLSFLDVIARQVLHLRRAHGCARAAAADEQLPHAAPTRSPRSRSTTGSRATCPSTSSSTRCRASPPADLSPVRWPADPELEWCPPGHGDLYLALETSGLLARAARARLPLRLRLERRQPRREPRPRHPRLVRRRAAPLRDGGVRPQRGPSQGRPPGAAARRRARAARDRPVPRGRARRLPGREAPTASSTPTTSGSTSTRWPRRCASRTGVLPLPMIRNEKTVDPADPSSPRGDPARDGDGRRDLGLPRRARAARARRSLRAGEDDRRPARRRSDAFVLTDDWRVVPAPGRAGDLVVDLDPAHYARVDQLEARFPAGAPSVAARRAAGRLSRAQATVRALRTPAWSAERRGAASRSGSGSSASAAPTSAARLAWPRTPRPSARCGAWMPSSFRNTRLPSRSSTRPPADTPAPAV